MRIVQKAYTFDDVLLVPAHSSILPRDVSLATQLTRNIRLNLPLVSAAMDTVTESRLAIALAQEGGIGIIHKNMSPARQAAEVSGQAPRVRHRQDPITIKPDMTVGGSSAWCARKSLSLPVIENGKGGGHCLNRDLRFESRLDARCAAS